MHFERRNAFKMHKLHFFPETKKKNMLAYPN